MSEITEPMKLVNELAYHVIPNLAPTMIPESNMPIKILPESLHCYWHYLPCEFYTASEPNSDGFKHIDNIRFIHIKGLPVGLQLDLYAYIPTTSGIMRFYLREPSLFKGNRLMAAWGIYPSFEKQIEQLRKEYLGADESECNAIMADKQQEFNAISERVKKVFTFAQEMHLINDVRIAPDE